MASQDREGGAFFANNKKQSDKAPDYRGSLRLSREVVMALNDQLQQGVQNPEIEISGWKRVANSGTTFISLAGKKPYAGNQGHSGGSGGGGQNRSDWPGQGGGQGGGWGGSSGRNADLGDDIPF